MAIKVTFKGVEEGPIKKMDLSFHALNEPPFPKVSSQLINGIKERSKSMESVFFFSNIERVTKTGKFNLHKINYHYVMLLESGGEKRGYLIANAKNQGDLVIGIWPFNVELIASTKEKIEDELKRLASNPQDYEKICLIAH